MMYVPVPSMVLKRLGDELAKLVVGVNDLASQCPEVAAEWDYAKNGDVTPEMVCYKSSKKYWWICSKHGVSWETKVTVRTRGHGCPQCAHEKKVRTNGTLADRFPEVAAEWHPTLNGDLTPNDVTGSTSTKVWWLGRCGHEWDMTVANRTTLGQGCPFCAGKRVLAGFNDLSTTDPNVADEWDYERNGDLKPTVVSHGSAKVVWWKCGSCGFSWQGVINKRTARNEGCPSCRASVKRTIRKPTHGMTLADHHPDVAAEWHPTKNGDLTPSDFTGGSGQKVWWLGKCGHEWDASIYARTRLGTGCPYCAGQRVIAGENDLATVNPSLAAKWHPTKNGALTPSDVAANSHRSVWWVCQSGHEWQAVIKNRNIDKSGCPTCGLSRHASFPEKAIAYYLGMVFDDVQENVRTGKPGLERFELDILVPSIGTAVEYDGQLWHTNPSRDIKKDEACEANGIRIIRIREPECAQYESTATFITREDAFDPKALDKAIEELLRLIGKDGLVTVDTESDYAAIYSMLNKQQSEKSLSVVSPDVAAQWHPTKNGDLKPSMFNASSKHRAWWTCPNGHEYQTRISHRTNGHGCPKCSAVANGDRPRKTHEQFVEELSEKNPTVAAVGKYSLVREKMAFKCLACGEEFETTPANILHGGGCPKCRYKRAGESRRRSSAAKRGMRADFDVLKRRIGQQLTLF